jgi:hypothetical protein
MGRILRRRIALAVAFVAVLAGGTAVALGATTTPKHSGARHARLRAAATHRRGGIVGAASAYLGLTPKQLKEQLASGKTLAQVAAATPGKSEAGLIAAIVAAVKAKIPSPPADLEAQVKALVNRSARTELNRHSRLGAARHGALRAAALAYLGISRHQLITELKSGKTLAQIADSIPGKSAAGLTEALVKVVKTKLNAAVAAHHLSARDEAARLTLLRARITQLLNHTHAGRHSTHSQAGAGTQAASPAPTT